MRGGEEEVTCFTITCYFNILLCNNGMKNRRVWIYNTVIVILYIYILIFNEIPGTSVRIKTHKRFKYHGYNYKYNFEIICHLVRNNENKLFFCSSERSDTHITISDNKSYCRHVWNTWEWGGALKPVKGNKAFLKIANSNTRQDCKNGNVYCLGNSRQYRNLSNVRNLKTVLTSSVIELMVSLFLKCLLTVTLTD